MIARQTARPLPFVESALTTRRLAVFAAIGPVLFWIVVGVVTALEWDFLHSLGWRETGPSPLPYPSITSLGPFGWLQILNFGQGGLATIALAIGLWMSVTPRPRVGIVFLFLGGVSGLTSMFKTDPTSGMPMTWHGWLHVLGFVLLVISFVGSTVAFAIGMRQSERWRWVGYAGLVLLVLAILATATGRLLPRLPFIYVGPSLLIPFAWHELLALRLLLLTRSVVSQR